MAAIAAPRQLVTDTLGRRVVPLVTPMFRTVSGRAGVEASDRDLLSRVCRPDDRDLDLLIDHENGDRAAYVFTHTARHVGDILGFPATGRKPNIHGVCLFRLKD